MASLGFDSQEGACLTVFLIYGALVLLYVFCPFSLECSRRGRRCTLRVRPLRGRASAGEGEAAGDGGRSGRIDGSPSVPPSVISKKAREEVFHLLLDKFSLTLQEGHMLRRGELRMAKKDIEEGNGTDDIEKGLGSTERTDSDVNAAPKELSLEGYTHISVPHPGVGVNSGGNSDDGREMREVPIFCAVCLSEYRPGDEVCWSSNPGCAHVFHKGCAVGWLAASGRRGALARPSSGPPNGKAAPCGRPECPCCRQDFVLVGPGA